MEFQETLVSLFSSTREIIVYAGQSYDWIDDKTVPSIGIRSYFADYENHDPVVDNIRFMICGTVLHAIKGEVTRLKDVDDRWCIIALRAVSMGGFPSATIELGRYNICKRTGPDEKGNLTFQLKRIE